MEIRTFLSELDFIQSSCDAVIQSLKDGAHIALSGGSTPGPIYQMLEKKVDLEKIHFWQVDERYVSHSHKDSNYKMIIETLHPKQFHAFNTSLPIDECLKDYEEEYRKNVQDGFDLCILGIGPDGHTASLFPNIPELHEKEKVVVHTQTDEFAVRDRLSLSFQSILQSKKILVLVRGRAKKEVLDELKHGEKTKEEFPAKFLLGHEGLTIYFGDDF